MLTVLQQFYRLGILKYISNIFPDSSAITNGNTKLILALLWQLVLRYQMGLTSFQHRSWLLAWVQAAIPDCHVTNLTTDWNTGIALQSVQLTSPVVTLFLTLIA